MAKTSNVASKWTSGTFKKPGKDTIGARIMAQRNVRMVDPTRAANAARAVISTQKKALVSDILDRAHGFLMERRSLTRSRQPQRGMTSPYTQHFRNRSTGEVRTPHRTVVHPSEVHGITKAIRPLPHGSSTSTRMAHWMKHRGKPKARALAHGAVGSVKSFGGLLATNLALGAVMNAMSRPSKDDEEQHPRHYAHAHLHNSVLDRAKNFLNEAE